MTSHKNLRILAIKAQILNTQLYVESGTIKPLTELATRGHQVTLFASTISKPTRRATTSLSLKLVQMRNWVPLLSLIYFELAAFRHLLASIAHIDVLILDPTSVPMLFPIIFLRRLCSPFPTILLHVESNVVYVGNPIREALCDFVDVLWTQFSSIAFDKILYISPMLSELYHELYRVPAEKAGVWPTVVEASFSESIDTVQTDDLRRRLGLGRQYGFLYHGALRIEGGLELVKAFRILREWSVNAILIIVGYGSDREVFAHYIKQHHLEDTVKLLGPVDHTEIPKYISACDAGIVPLPDNIRWRYQCPIKLLELLAMNKPVIVSDIPAHRWIIGNAPVAFFLRGTDPLSIAEGIREFLAIRCKLNPALGPDIVRERFTPQRIADSLEKQILSRQTNGSLTASNAR